MKACDACSAAIDVSIAQKEEAYRIRAEVLAGLDEYAARVQAIKSHVRHFVRPQHQEAAGKCVHGRRGRAQQVPRRADGGRQPVVSGALHNDHSSGAQRREAVKAKRGRMGCFSDGKEKADRTERMEVAKGKVGPSPRVYVGTGLPLLFTVEKMSLPVVLCSLPYLLSKIGHVPLNWSSFVA
jgi:hypothetical protein